MASDKNYLNFILDQLNGLDGISYRAMMGEYLLYFRGKLVGGVYDDRFLVKDTKASRAVLSASEIPYDGASEMMLVDIEDRDAVADLVIRMLPELPEPKRRRK